MIGLRVKLFKECRMKVPDGNGGWEWRDFREDELHRPYISPTSTQASIDDSSSNLLYEGTPTMPRKGRLLSEIELPIEYAKFAGVGSRVSIPKFIMLDMKADETSAFEVLARGWVDSVEPIATKGPLVNTLIRWHVDYWHTITALEFSARLSPSYDSRGLSFGRGTFKRGPAGMARPDPGAPRKWVYKSASRIKDIAQNNLGGDWAIFLVSSSNSGWNNNTIKFFPINGSISGSGLCPEIQDIMNGNIITMMGTSSDKIIGAWFSAVAPYNPPNANIEHNSQSTRFWYSATYTGTSDFTFYGNMPGDVTADDSTRVQLTDMLGNPIYTLPWGMTFNCLKLQVDIGANGSQLIVGFINYDPTDPLSPFNEKPETEGRTAIVPLPAIPLFSNAMSDYVYSGQREFDIDNAKMQREQAVWSGVANLGSSVIGGAVAGSVAAPGAGTIAGAVAGFASGTIGVGANAVISTHYDIKSQEMTDKLVSNQAGGVVQYGGGDYSYRAPFGAAVLITQADPLSKGVLAAEQSEMGYVTDVFTTNCTTVIQSGGPMRIEGLEVKGDLSKEARTYIQQMFARGVHLDLIY